MYVKEEWRSALKAGGEQFVTTDGIAEMHLWFVDNWATLHLVSEPQ